MSVGMWQNTPAAIFQQGAYEGSLTVGELLRHGNTGVGEFELLDGELVLAKGRPFRAQADGRFTEANLTDLLCFAIVAPLVESATMALPDTLSERQVEARMAEKLAPDRFYVLHLSGHFARVKVRAIPRQQPPFPTFDLATQQQRVFDLDRAGGTLVGFYTPSFIGQLGVPGFHWHFVDDASQRGGHALDFDMEKGEVEYRRLTSLEVKL